ncbi:MAG: pilus assembly protein PilB [Cyanobacteria bacterium P01_D01_bin.56]
MSTFPEDNVLSSLAHALKNTESKADLEQMFLLIESILPFEACLYYQVLPLSIEGSVLNLGVVNPDDTSAADYVRRQVSYINCSIVSQPISSDWHREILSKFLSHSAKNRQSSQQPDSQQNSASSFVEHPTLVVGAPTEIIEHSRPKKGETPKRQPSAAAPVSPPLHIDFPQADSTREQSSASSITKEKGLPLFDQFNPKELTQTLLKQLITQEGIGRLYLERRQGNARILWSKDGVVQSVMDDISSQLFQGVINELKRMMSVALIPVRKPKQVEIERIHNQKRILLRFRVMPGDHGEEATLQILRGAALKFYQQQQIDSIGRDALGIAKDLQYRIDELRVQAQRNLDAQDTKQKTLPAIMNMLRQMEQQLHDIIESPD